MKILVVNAGSSSLKYQVIDAAGEQTLCGGVVEAIGQKSAKYTHKVNGRKYEYTQEIPDHTAALSLVLKTLTDRETGVLRSLDEIGAIGHRYVHSGETFKENVLVTDEVLKACKANIPLAPLHMPAHIACTESCMKLLPTVPNVIVFDTVFHATMPDYAYTYAIDYEDAKNYQVRRYGFHGTSHKYVSREAVKLLGFSKSKIITCHLGNGSSMAAVYDGKCVDTSMGLTPLEGMVMGTRSGDIDPAAVSYLAECKGLTASEMSAYLNNNCGFKGLCGVSDFRKVTELAKSGDERAILAVKVFAYRIKKYIGAYAVALGGLDAIVFTGGIGENASFARENIMRGLEWLGIEFDYEKNVSAPIGSFQVLSKENSKVKIFVIPTDEELVIAREAKELVEKA